MFEISKQFHFQAAHRLPEHDGKCQRLHGHSWVATVIFRRVFLNGNGPKTGMLVDFGDIKNIVQPIVDEKLDHHYLNETLPEIVPTSECIAEWLFAQIQPLTPDLYAVEIEETCTSKARYQR